MSFRPQIVTMVLALGISSQTFAVPSAGNLDPTFGNFKPGVSTAAFDLGGALIDRGRAVASDSEGRLYVAGRVQTMGDPCIGVARFSPDGQADHVFGDAGKSCLTFSQAGNVDVTAAVVQDEKLLIAGLFLGQSSTHPYVCRLLADGSDRDSTFGEDGNGCILLESMGGVSDTTSMILGADGTILVSGFVSSPGPLPHLARLSPDGGVLQIAPVFPGSAAIASGSVLGMTLDNEGRILAVGRASEASSPFNNAGFIARLMPESLALDASFVGGDGFAVIDAEIMPNGNDIFSAVTVLPAEEIIVVGSGSYSGNRVAGLIWQFAENGALEANWTMIGCEPGDVCRLIPRAVAASPAGNIVIAGTLGNLPIESTDVFIWSFLQLGLQPDTAFGHDAANPGLVRIPLAPSAADEAFGIVMQGDSIVVGGSRTSLAGPTDLDFMLARVSGNRSAIFENGFETN